MSTHFALVVEWQLPDDADHTAADAALRDIVDKIHAGSPAPTDRVTAYLGVSAELIAEAARTGAIVNQAERLQLAPGDVVTIRLPDPDRWSENEIAEQAKAAKQAFPDHEVVFLGRGATVEAKPADED